MKKFAVIALVFLLGIGAGAFSANHYLGQFMLHSLYVNSAAQATAYTAILKAQRAGNYSEATEWMEQFLKSEVIILEGCKHDLCREKSIPQVAKALELVKGYQSVQHTPNNSFKGTPNGAP